MSVCSGSSSQSAAASPLIRSLASSAADPARAAASAACTRAATWAGEVALPLTDALLTPSAPRMNDTTVIDTECITPLVVRVLFAQRRLALVWSRTIAMQSSEVELTRACSTRDWGVATVISGLPRRWC